MNAKPNIDMLEATRLTREGRLAEAMAILQGGLPGSPPSASSDNTGDDADQRSTGRGGPSLASRIIDMVPPSSGGGAWTAPKFNSSHFAPNTFGGLAGRSAQAQVPEALRGFLD